jgi:hypothetical protein
MVNVTIYESIEDETIRKKVIGNLTEYRDHVAGLKNANTLRAALTLYVKPMAFT